MKNGVGLDMRMGRPAGAAEIGHHGGHDILARLRAETRAEHEAIEETLGLVDKHLTLAFYRRRLKQFHGFYKPIEWRLASIAGWQEHGIDLEARRKTKLLAADLLALGVDEVERLPICEVLPELRDIASSFGCLYVLEGSTLGGQVMSRHIEKTLGIRRETGGSFFRGYGEKTGEMWTSFRRSLLAFPRDKSAEDRMIGAAIATFRDLRQWFEEGGREG